MKIIFSKHNFDETVKELKENGYIWCNGELTFEELDRAFPNTIYFIIDAYYNRITKRKEMQYETEYFFKKHYKI